MNRISVRKSRRGLWYWGFLIPLALVVCVPFYNRVEPSLWGLPFFYWVQMLFVVIGAVVTWAIYRLTPSRGESARPDRREAP
jgi:Na+-driven multidrug efflux pump